eukprot:643830-Karenia_brevis.AAC.1
MYGTQYGEGNLPISPVLREYMGIELGKRNAIEKERRKALELRDTLHQRRARETNPKAGSLE